MRWLVDLAPVVMISGSICGLASFGWITVQAVQGRVRTRRDTRARTAKRYADGVIADFVYDYLRDMVLWGGDEADTRQRAKVETMPLDQLAILRRNGRLTSANLSDERRATLDDWMARHGR